MYSPRLPALFFVSFALLVLSRLDHPITRDLRVEAESWIAPALSTAMLPLDPARRLLRQVQSSYDGFAEIERLRNENQRLKQWESRARELERKAREMAILARAVEQQPLDYMTVRVIATSSGAFVHSALLEAGTEHGVRVGQPVINASGVLGRIVEAGRRTSRLLLLTDVNSRVPVFVGSQQIRAVLMGDNGAEPRLDVLPQDAELDQAEEVLTSGVGGMFPRGLRVGHVSLVPSGARVKLVARPDELEFVSILKFENPGVALTREVRPSNGTPTYRQPSAAHTRQP
jgi:rod shape-determining protein MreC